MAFLLFSLSFSLAIGKGLIQNDLAISNGSKDQKMVSVQTAFYPAFS
jgi:hypothetical protein